MMAIGAKAAWTALALTLAGAHPAQAQVQQPSVERAPGSIEPATEDKGDPLELQLVYTGDILTTVAGGGRRGARWIHNVSAIASADLEQLAGIPRTRAVVHAFYNNGASFSGDLVGDAQVVSSIETGVPMLRLFEAWVEHTSADESLSAKAGLYDVNSEFDALQTSLLFVHSAFGMGSDLGTSGRNGPSTFPSTGLAFRGQAKLHDSLTVRVAVADGVPNNPAFPRRLSFGLHSGEGAFLIGEGDVELGNIRLLAGAWVYTARADDRFDAATDAAVMHHVRSDGAYLRGEAQLTGDSGAGVRAFVRLGIASERANIFDRFASGGLVWRGLIPGRGDDDTGIAIAYAGAGSASRDLAKLRYGRAPRGETAIELTHRITIDDRFGLQPHVQYVIDPGLDPRAGNALVVGLRLTAGIKH